MSAEQFRAVRQRHASAAALVLFIGFPVLPHRDLAALKQNRQKIVVVSAALPGYKLLVESGVVHLAIVPRPVAGGDQGKRPQSLREWFDQEYLVATPETASTLPY